MTGTLVALASRAWPAGADYRRIGVGSPANASFATLVAITVFWSIGFHLYASMAPVITLRWPKDKKADATSVAWVLSARSRHWPG
jgi:hypothetical protein